MTPTSIRSLGSAAVFALVVSLGPGARASAEAAPQARTAEAKAKADFKRGHQAYEMGRFDEALQAYSAAYDAAPLPAFLFNIAQCHRQLGHYERAAFFFQRFLDKAGESPNAPAAKALLVEVQAKQTEQQAQADKKAASEHEQAMADARALAAHAEAQAAAERRAEWDAKANADRTAVEKARAEADLAAQAQRSANTVANTVATSTTPPAPPAPEAKPLVTRWWFWGAIAVGAVVAGTAIAYAASAPHAPTPSLGTIHAQ